MQITLKNQFTSNIYSFAFDFERAPMEIGVSAKFAQYIASNIPSPDFVSDPRGLIEGYYYAS